MTDDSTTKNRISEKVNLAKIPMDTPQFYSISKNQDWVEKLLRELNEKADTNSPEENLAQTRLDISLELKKQFKSQYGEYLLIKGTVEALYLTQCIRSLEEMEEQLHIEFNVAFLHARFEQDETLQEELEIIENTEVYELYFFKKGHVDLFETLHEVIYLNFNQYPVKSESTPLVWANGESGKKH